MRNISQARLLEVEVPDVPLVDQQDDVARLTIGSDAVDALTGSLEAARRRQQALRRALLDAAFSGRLTDRPSGRDSMEELAGV
jgi:type I restriction enzyme S subunit